MSEVLKTQLSDIDQYLAYNLVHILIFYWTKKKHSIFKEVLLLLFHQSTRQASKTEAITVVQLRTLYGISTYDKGYPTVVCT